MSVCFLVFTVGPPSRSRVRKSVSSQLSCPPCDCFCSSAEYLLDPLGKFLFLVSLQCSNIFGLEVKKRHKLDWMR